MYCGREPENGIVREFLKPVFDKRCEAGVNMILQSGLKYHEIGIFGSYARGTYKSTSDIDFYVIVDRDHDRGIAAMLACSLDENDMDIVLMTQDRFDNEESAMMRGVRRDHICLIRTETATTS